MAKKRKSSKPTRTDIAEARAIVAGVFPYFPLPQKFSRRDGPALWVFHLIPKIATALAKRSRPSAST